MEKRNIVSYDLSRLHEEYLSKFRQLSVMARKCKSPELFKEELRVFVAFQAKTEAEDGDTPRKVAAERILRLIDYDGTTVDELSTGEQLPVRTITYLWRFLNGVILDGDNVSADLLIDLYYLFLLLKSPPKDMPFDLHRLKRQMNRWPTGLDEEVAVVRRANKGRVIRGLIRKIDRHHASSSRYLFADNATFEEKYRTVEEWWNSSRFHLLMAVKSPSELNNFLGNTLPPETMRLLAEAKKKGIPFFVTPYYLSLLNTGKEGYDDASIRSYVLYSKELIETYGTIRAWEKEDLIVPGKPNAAGWLLSEANNIHRRYPDVAILIPDSIGRACGGLCASCQRMYDFQSERLNFDFESLRPKESWDKKLRRLMQYFEDDAQLRDILITGGDALMSRNETLRKILDAVCRMAVRKRKANESRPDGEKYAEIRRIRLGSRLPAYLPMRINDELTDILKEFKEKAAAAGITQCYLQTHFQSPLEITPEAKRAVEAVLAAGWTVTNQLVFTAAASRRGHTAKLRQALNAIGVVGYYTFSVKGFRENYAVFAPNSRSMQERNEEKRAGFMSEEKRKELDTLIRTQRPLGKQLIRFLKQNSLPFAGTDRNVLNLPGIGKSMNFHTIGITAEGRRILRFDHDAGRRHSPIIHQMGKVYIVENKSVAAYLRQLQEMGEDISEYQTIWSYCEGKTEPRFSIYDYPAYPFRVTDRMTNLQLTVNDE